MAELGEEAPNANEHVSAAGEEEGTWLVSGSNTAALVPGLGGDGRFAELGKEELKANEQTAVEAALADEEVSSWPRRRMHTSWTRRRMQAS